MAKNVEGINWTESVVAQSPSPDAFVALHMADSALYDNLTPDQKEKALRLAYSLCVPDWVEPLKEPEEEEKHRKPRK